MLNPIVATKPGPYVIDVHQLDDNGFDGFVGADGEEPAGGIFKWDTQDDGTAFDPGTLYAFSYDTLPAQYPATQVELDGRRSRDLRQSWSRTTGTSTSRRAPTLSASASPGCATEAKFESLAGGVFDGSAMRTPRRRCTACSDGTMQPRASTASTRSMATWTRRTSRTAAIEPNANGATVAQVTIHTDHVFWDKLKQEGTPLRMDYDRGVGRFGHEHQPARPRLRSPTSRLATTVSRMERHFPTARRLSRTRPARSPADQAIPNQVTLDLNGVTASNISGLSASWPSARSRRRT